jgi:hypothetical protein
MPGERAALAAYISSPKVEKASIASVAENKKPKQNLIQKPSFGGKPA